MKKERSFQEGIDQFLTEVYGYYVVGSIAPGHPDRTAIKNGEVLLIEIKDLERTSPNIKLKDFFTRAQIPWMLRFHKKKFGETYIAVNYFNKGHVYIVDSVASVEFLLDATIGEFIDKCVKFESDSSRSRSAFYVTRYIVNGE